MGEWTFMVMTQEKEIGATKNDVVFVLPPNSPIKGKDTLKYYQPVCIELPDEVGKEYMERKVRPNAQFTFDVVGDLPKKEHELIGIAMRNKQNGLPAFGLTIDIEKDLGLSNHAKGRAKSLKCNCVPVHAEIDIVKKKV